MNIIVVFLCYFSLWKQLNLFVIILYFIHTGKQEHCIPRTLITRSHVLLSGICHLPLCFPVLSNHISSFADKHQNSPHNQDLTRTTIIQLSLAQSAHGCCCVSTQALYGQPSSCRNNIRGSRDLFAESARPVASQSPASECMRKAHVRRTTANPGGAVRKPRFCVLWQITLYC